MKAKREIVGGAVVVVTLLIATTLLSIAGDGIDAAEQRAKEQAAIRNIERVINVAYDSDPIDSKKEVTNEVLFGTLSVAQLWTLERGATRTGHVIQVPVPEAYNDEMSVAVGVDSTGRITGVNVPMHNETPAYGGRLIGDDGFLRTFVGRSVTDDDASWDVSAATGPIDGVTGATITKTAVTHGVYRALRQLNVLVGAGDAHNETTDGVK